MQRFLAILLILAGLGGIGFGVATATVLRESDTVVATATPSGDGTMVVTEPGVLGLVDDQVTVRATVPEGQKVTLALGSDVDVLGWVGDDPYDSVTGLSSWETLRVVPGTAAAPEGEAAEGEETDEAPAEKPSTGPEPAGSDMWISEVSGETAVSMRWTEQPGRVVLLAAGVGKGAEAPTLELTWPRQASTPYLWPGVLGGSLLLILGVFMAIGARRSAKRRSGNGRPPSAVRTRQPDSELPRRDVVLGIDGEQSSPAGHEPAAGFPPALGDPAEGGTAVYPPVRPEAPGRDRPDQRPVQSPVPSPVPSPARHPEPALTEPEHTRSWGAPAPFGGAAPITPPPVPERDPEPVAAPAASIRGIRRRRGQAPGAAPAATAQPPAQRTPFGGAAPEQAPAPAEAPSAAQTDPAASAASGRPMTRREMRMREQAQRRAATGAMPTVPASEPEPEPEVEQPQTPSSRAAAWRQTWGVTGNDGGN
ncbi:hypothetical protein [Promicromonospora iranensis]|uniref:Pyruvate/2-oxoglutarate dehydrogenase complex dihydrolipoamide acyltransferase (E2) component n=1 Tax=Promicromonospora iranensis TaxID=1105144 RepID=A0ABU2CS88_9MICO|nr:hypothetical protein [Promicromonospora iranensis]MDR7384205.1 pyruvate/2-oxoglutarate dehydrogenase complex dihydrolipoamide acyltransferase (E2) component [Promicromonospora iranensis]